MKVAILIPLIVLLISCSKPAPEDAGTSLVQASTENNVVAHTGDNSMVGAATAFLNSLTPELKSKAAYSFDDEQREIWNYVPMNDRVGARIGHLNEKQQELAFALLKTGLSNRGYKIAREIMALEEILFIKENQKPGSDYRNSTKYFLTIFGTPTSEAPWSWKYEGHHLSLNYSSVEGEVSVTPAFFGTNPAEVDIEKGKGKRVLAELEDRGRELMHSLNSEQQKKALISTEAYSEILTESKSFARLEKFEGLPYEEMTLDQQNKLADLIKYYTNTMEPKIANEQWTRIKDHKLHSFYFAWAGGLKRNEKHYYRIHGPVTIIEYDNTQNNGNHAHSVWRDTSNDFGRDLLKEHHMQHEH